MILFVGDSHGDDAFIEKAIQLAQEHQALIVQAGDWGFIWPNDNKLDVLNLLLDKYNVEMRFIDGNHDVHPELFKLPKTDHNLGSRLTYQHRGSTHTTKDGTTFMFMGGAPSIDRIGRALGRSWWPEEEITDQELAFGLASNGKIDVLVTHDAPGFPPGKQPIHEDGDEGFVAACQRSMDCIRQLMLKHKPKLLVHGHWHMDYFDRSGDTKIVGLASNIQAFKKAIYPWG